MDLEEALSQRLSTLAKHAGDPSEVEGYEEASADLILTRQHRVSMDAASLASIVELLRQLPWLREFEQGHANVSPTGSAMIMVAGRLLSAPSLRDVAGRLPGGLTVAPRSQSDPCRENSANRVARRVSNRRGGMDGTPSGEEATIA